MNISMRSAAVANAGVDSQWILACDILQLGILRKNAQLESCVTFLPEINGNLKCRIGTSALAEAIGILITRSAKMARNLGRVITPEHVALLSYLIFFGEQQAGRWLRWPYFILEFYPIKDAAIYEPGSTEGTLQWQPNDGGRRGVESSMVNVDNYRTRAKEEKESRFPDLFNFQ